MSINQKVGSKSLLDRRVCPRLAEPRVHSAAKPDFYRVYKADQVTDVVHSVAPDMKRAKAVEFNASGPNLSKIFDGKEQLVAVTSSYWGTILGGPASPIRFLM
jgi:hypothetical protein